MMNDSGLIKLLLSVASSFPTEEQSVIAGDFYTLHLPLGTANGSVVCNGRLLFRDIVQQGMMRLAAPGEHITVSRKTPSRELILEIPGELMRQIFDKMAPGRGKGPPPCAETVVEPAFQVARLAQTLSSALEFEDECQQLFIDGLAYSLLACLFDGRSHSAGRAPAGPAALSNKAFARCFAFAEAQLENNLDITAWAKVVGMTATEYNRCFRVRTGLAPYAWFMNLRIERAKQRLQDKEQDIADVALRLGFNSQSHFSEAFRKRVGCSPTKWRADIRAGI
jgi:AraC family transcriptional regulator